MYIAAARGAYSGKPRPVVVVQDDRFDATASVTVVPFTTSDVDAPLFRIVVQPSETTGLAETSRLMIAELARRAGAADPQVLGKGASRGVV
ncbi:type II toxin-antitoxin system PemK/MazF family toxin [Mycobacterium avium subsp. hominissuis]|nr:type II toxin-antitoxin system PemK/MazF family toxin [Mycobacterium avium subsp. hominissuis]MCA4739688.1 type II toxin-antitoxin system PemK/MazF family toxin [Mycobacterium avium subsp. hominissuis]MCA4743736.1 type II toxin-antitoxin system PemK/MazF family toxin [Mycobacterium avium subsp. hominissuis]MCA4762620.1 type II toxin-antitoxin system PemK/MazF family toxin [Mycobacterium avium subsp. hominissuis]UBV03057.1 type II toxin-antitoxin system PemK/MazF family toxin [Mycobacterium a